MRIKAAVYTRQRKKKVFKIAKGYYADRGTRWRQVLQQVRRSLRYSYVSRKDLKGDFRQIWIARINAAVRPSGLSYSRFVSGLKKSNIALNRKMLSELAIHDNASFNQLIKQSQSTFKA